MGARSTVTVYCMSAFEVAETYIFAGKMGGNSGGQEVSLCRISASMYIFFNCIAGIVQLHVCMFH